ncbi:hypothetical protein SYJ56_23690 [Algoriphagus sp. D3-2-R+10]|uniref:hypothetical protein n=1 Tax=Algoriphagus aurantiacus TaxID=3103948 RepID=UPI002B3F5654|nr:hypothetical protein [Algoriphagus sp. D3-2-R+10]MEB2778333.1 hypothetical protein [Algoriphagus sp. D3-2-R+10]
MSKKEITAKELIIAQNRANQKAKKLIRVLGLEDIVARNNKIIQISPNGTEVTIKESRFKSKKASKGIFKLQN